jgi:hypothetical protein
MRDGEPNIYGAIATLRNGYLQGQWQRVQMFLVFNTVAIPIVLATATSDKIRLALSSAAVLAHLAIMQGTLRADSWLEFFDSRLIELENLDAEDPNGVRVRVFSHPDFSPRRRTWFASRWLFGYLGIVAFIFWIWQLIGQIQIALH